MGVKQSLTYKQPWVAHLRTLIVYKTLLLREETNEHMIKDSPFLFCNMHTCFEKWNILINDASHKKKTKKTKILIFWQNNWIVIISDRDKMKGYMFFFFFFFKILNLIIFLCDILNLHLPMQLLFNEERFFTYGQL